MSKSIKLLEKKHSVPFMNDLISSQIDVDRIDYIKRDSYYTGIPESDINQVRIINILNVYNQQLVFEEKGILSVNRFIQARGFMYAQIYYHKTNIIVENMLRNVFKRALLFYQKHKLESQLPEWLAFFLQAKSSKKTLTQQSLKWFSMLDDYDVFSVLKFWQNSKDPVLKRLSTMIIERKLLKMTISDSPFSQQTLRENKRQVAQVLDLKYEDTSFFVFAGVIPNISNKLTYNDILIYTKDMEVKRLDQYKKINFDKELKALDVKYFLCSLKV